VIDAFSTKAVFYWVSDFFTNFFFLRRKGHHSWRDTPFSKQHTWMFSCVCWVFAA